MSTDAEPPGASGPSSDGLPLALRHAVSLLSPGPKAERGDTPAPAASSPSESAARPRVTGRPVRVQIVEDLPRVQQLLRQLVEQAGDFEVTAIDDTEQMALSHCHSTQPDVVVVDLNLRQGSGLGLINGVRRALGPSPTGPLVIVVTNHTMPILKAACMKAGADHFLDKSRELPRLAALLQTTFQA